MDRWLGLDCHGAIIRDFEEANDGLAIGGHSVEIVHSRCVEPFPHISRGRCDELIYLGRHSEPISLDTV